MKEGLLVLLVAVVAAVGVSRWLDRNPASLVQKETTYERIIRTGTVRCGYAIYEPLLEKDPNTGALHGVFYDLLNEVGKELNLKIEWTAEIGYGEIEEGFQSGKYDIFCNGTVPTPQRAKFDMVTVPVFYGGLVAWVRANDHRFDNNVERLNAPDVTLVVRDGDVNAEVARTSFPQAKTVSSPQMVDYTQMLVDVETGKADAAFFEKAFGNNFLAKNPGAVRCPAPDKPVDVYQVGLMLPPGEAQLKNMIDLTLTKLILNGTVKKLIEKDAGPNYSYMPVAQPYESKP
jgi:polar amino acid transport system substrate-binding protein